MTCDGAPRSLHQGRVVNSLFVVSVATLRPTTLRFRLFVWRNGLKHFQVHQAPVVEAECLP